MKRFFTISLALLALLRLFTGVALAQNGYMPPPLVTIWEEPAIDARLSAELAGTLIRIYRGTTGDYYTTNDHLLRFFNHYQDGSAYGTFNNYVDSLPYPNGAPIEVNACGYPVDAMIYCDEEFYDYPQDPAAWDVDRYDDSLDLELQTGLNCHGEPLPEPEYCDPY